MLPAFLMRVLPVSIMPYRMYRTTSHLCPAWRLDYVGVVAVPPSVIFYPKPTLGGVLCCCCPTLARAQRVDLVFSHWKGGVLAGGLHAVSGPDHLAALLPRIMGQKWHNSMRIGATWGLGHGFSATVIGLAVSLCGGGGGGGTAVVGRDVLRPIVQRPAIRLHASAATAIFSRVLSMAANAWWAKIHPYSTPAAKTPKLKPIPPVNETRKAPNVVTLTANTQRPD